MDVVDAIVNSATDGQDRPLEEIKMIKVSLVWLFVHKNSSEFYRKGLKMVSFIGFYGRRK